jgi:hypothetical protein
MPILIAPSDLPSHNREAISVPWALICENYMETFWIRSKHAHWLQSFCITAALTQFMSSQKERRLSANCQTPLPELWAQERVQHYNGTTRALVSLHLGCEAQVPRSDEGKRTEREISALLWEEAW